MKLIEKLLAKIGYFKLTTKALDKPEFLDYKIATLKCQWLSRGYTANKIGIALQKDKSITIHIYEVPEKDGKPDLNKMLIQRLSKETFFVIDEIEYGFTEDISLIDFTSENIFPITNSNGKFLYYDISITTDKYKRV